VEPPGADVLLLFLAAFTILPGALPDLGQVFKNER
jgi:hypothetical protein